jgi:hypothetical protein
LFSNTALEATGHSVRIVAGAGLYGVARASAWALARGGNVKGQLTGMRGVYFVAAELCRLGFIASPTSRSAFAADILVTDQACQRAFSVQVKTNSAAASFWLVGKHTVVSDTHVHVLVNLRSKEDASQPEYFVVPSRVVKARTVYSKHPNSEFYSVYRKDILDYRDKWDVFGDSPVRQPKC